jgi:hypothetical protein
MFTRRGWLAGGMAAALAFAARRAFAIGPGARFTFGQLQLGGGGRNDLGPRPVALRRLAWEIEKRTSIDVQLEPVLQTPTSDTLHETPFLYLSGERELELPSAAGIEALRRFLTFGGFLLIDSAEGPRRRLTARSASWCRRSFRRSARPRASRSCRTTTWSTSRSTCSIGRSAGSRSPRRWKP